MLPVRQITAIALKLSISELRIVQSVLDGIIQHKSNAPKNPSPQSQAEYILDLLDKDTGLNDLSNGLMNDGREANEEINRVALSQFSAFRLGVSRRFNSTKDLVRGRLMTLDRSTDEAYIDFLAHYFLAARWRRSQAVGRDYDLNRFIESTSSIITPEELFGVWPDQDGGLVTPGLVALLPIVLGILRADYRHSARPSRAVLEALRNLRNWDDLRPGYTLGEMYAIARGEDDEELAAEINTDFFKAFPYDLEGKA